MILGGYYYKHTTTLPKVSGWPDHTMVVCLVNWAWKSIIIDTDAVYPLVFGVAKANIICVSTA